MPNANIGATKYDVEKPPISLIPTCAVEAEARVLGHGAVKYAADNWRGGFKWRRLIDAILRHAFAIADGEDRDPETGELHTAHIRCEAGFLHEHMERGLGTDDRYYRPIAVPTTVGVSWAEPGVDVSADVSAITPGMPPVMMSRSLPGQKPPRAPTPFSYWYLATPYAKYPGGRLGAFHLAARLAGLVMRLDIPVFSPIAHSHPVATQVDLPQDHEFWMAVDRPFMDAASGLIVVTAESWEESVGMAEEIGVFKDASKPIVLWDPATRVPVEDLRRYMPQR